MWQKIKNLYHLFQAITANLIYNFPSKKITTIGITGTDGKTTTTHLIYHILKENNYPSSMLSTVYGMVAGKEYETGLHVTTPSSFIIERFLAEAVKNKQRYFILETTSHALDQNRVFGIKYFIGVITNITHEHLDYHQSFENYVKAKVKLINQSNYAVLNKDSSVFSLIKKYIKNKNLKIINYSQNINHININYLPPFILENYAAAYTVCQILNLPHEKIINAMKTFSLPQGRINVVYDKKFYVIIDFAHTPHALEVLLPFIKEKYIKNNGRLIHIFGSAGLRDKLKRPKMGAISSQNTDLIILTEEDYRTENLNEICQQIASGIDKKKFRYKNKNEFSGNERQVYTFIPNRDQAIKFAIRQAKDNDVILLSGKGHEKSLARGKKEVPWDEKKIVLKILEKFNYL